VEQFIHRKNLEHYRRLLAAPDQKSLSWRVVTRGFDENRAGACGCIAPGVGGDVATNPAHRLMTKAPGGDLGSEKIPQPGEFYNMRRRQNRAD
jgi:hypothetical protein